MLAAIVSAVWMVNGNDDERSFSRDLCSFMPDQISQLTVVSSDASVGKRTFKFTNGNWTLVQDGVTYDADLSEVRNLIFGLRNMSVVRILATKKSKWKNLDMLPSKALGITIKLLNGDEQKVWLGYYIYQSEADNHVDSKLLKAESTRYFTNVRVADDEKVYVIEGALRPAFEKPLSAYRNKVLINSSVSNWSKLTLTHGDDSSYVMTRDGRNWTINGLACDSMQMVRYLRSISKISGNEFYDGDKTGLKTVKHQLTIEGDEMLEPIIITCFENRGTLVIRSSMNSGAFLANGEAFYSRIFKQKLDVR